VPAGDVTHADGTRTLHFTSDDVTDFAFAASPDFKTRLATSGPIDIALYYLPEHAAAVDEYISSSVESLQMYGEWYGAYPHPRLTVVDVPEDAEGAGGMEYPTLVTGGTGGLPSNAGFVAYITSHEIAHQWWPMQTATNESREPWLDEGLTEYSGMRYMIDAGRRLGFGVAGVGAQTFERLQLASEPELSATLSASQYSSSSYVVVYTKTALGLWTLESVVGTEPFRHAMADYLAQQRFKHPNGADFRAALERSLGDLSWFFDEYMNGQDVIDYAAGPIENGPSGSAAQVIRKGGVRVPVDVRVTLASGAQQVKRWQDQSQSVRYSFPAGDPIVRVEVDPDHKLHAEINLLDNGVSAAPETLPALTLAGRLIFWLQVIVQSIGLFG
jgi:hypothetical protein